MQRNLAIAATCLFFLLPVASGHAQCVTGSTATSACQIVLDGAKVLTDQIKQCFQELDDEYNGRTGHGVGKGPHYEIKKAECRSLAQAQLDTIDFNASAPGTSTAAKRALGLLAHWK